MAPADESNELNSANIASYSSVVLALVIIGLLLTGFSLDTSKVKVDIPEQGVKVVILSKQGACTCENVFAPVCGKNNKTYFNACFAKCENAEIAKQGSCEQSLVLTTLGMGGSSSAVSIGLPGQSSTPTSNGGNSGTTGAGGSSGTTGSTGAPGASGINGTNGADGRNGNDGATGATGATGPAGPAGEPGTSGSNGNTPDFSGSDCYSITICTDPADTPVCEETPSEPEPETPPEEVVPDEPEPSAEPACYGEGEACNANAQGSWTNEFMTLNGCCEGLTCDGTTGTCTVPAEPPAPAGDATCKQEGEHCGTTLVQGEQTYVNCCDGLACSSTFGGTCVVANDSSQPAPADTCDDTDVGDDEAVLGSVSGTLDGVAYTHSDACTQGKFQLTQYHCSAADTPIAVVTYCTGGQNCLHGVCR